MFGGYYHTWRITQFVWLLSVQAPKDPSELQRGKNPQVFFHMYRKLI